MPALSIPRTQCIAKLANELCFASKPTLIRHLERIDLLAPNIDPDGVYPEDWIVFRVTGYRTQIDQPALIPGDALLGDLSALAERLSDSAPLTTQDLEPDTHTIASLMDRWNVSRRTIDRYRRLGLIARRIDAGRGVRTLAFLPGSVDWFEQCNAPRLGRAAQFTRSDPAEKSRIERWARRYRAKLGWSRSRTAARIAQRTGRCHEGVRKILLRLDNENTPPIFPEPGPASSREQRFLLRAYQRGIPTAELAQRTNRPPSAIHRAIHAARLDLLNSWEINPPENHPPRPDEPDLETPPAIEGLGATRTDDLHELIGFMRIRTPGIVYEERARTRAYRALIARATITLDSIDTSNVSGILLDEIETSLRWASQIKSALIQTELSLVLTTIENRIAGPIDSLQPARAAQLLLEGIGVACAALDRYNPDHGGRLAAPIGLALTKYASRQQDAAVRVAEGKAARRIPPGFIIKDWTRSVSIWQRDLDPDPRIHPALNQLTDEQQLILRNRFGFGGTPPQTMSSIANNMGIPRVQLIRKLRDAYRSALSAARAQENPRITE